MQRAHAASATPTLKRRVVVLTIGSDAGAPKFGRGGAMESGRADALQLVVIDTVKRRGSILSFPRDSYVPIPGYGTNKINAAMAFGGPRLLVATFEQLTGLTIDYYALTSFDGLTDIVNKVGKVRVNVDMNLRDTFAGAFLDKGKRNLTGGQALAYARARKTLPGGDFDRSRHQGQLLIGGLGTFQGQVAEDPAKVMTWLGDHPRGGQDRPALPRAAAPGPAGHRRPGQRHQEHPGAQCRRQRRRRLGGPPPARCLLALRPPPRRQAELTRRSRRDLGTKRPVLSGSRIP